MQLHVPGVAPEIFGRWLALARASFRPLGALGHRIGEGLEVNRLAALRQKLCRLSGVRLHPRASSFPQSLAPQPYTPSYENTSHCALCRGSGRRLAGCLRSPIRPVAAARGQPQHLPAWARTLPVAKARPRRKRWPVENAAEVRWRPSCRQGAVANLPLCGPLRRPSPCPQGRRIWPVGS